MSNSSVSISPGRNIRHSPGVPAMRYLPLGNGKLPVTYPTGDIYNISPQCEGKRGGEMTREELAPPGKEWIANVHRSRSLNDGLLEAINRNCPDGIGWVNEV